jgi:hypothetical protein
MKKILGVMMLLVFFAATNAFAQGNANFCYGGWDELYNYWDLTDENGDPLPDGSCVQVLYVGADGEIDPPSLTEKGTVGASDDDEVVGEDGVYNPGCIVTITVNGSDPHPVTGDSVYMRVFDGNQGSLTTSNYYGDSKKEAATGTDFDELFFEFPSDPDGPHTDTPLPVELMTFDAIARDGEVLLEWKTASETNLLGFYIERDGKIESGLIEGQGNTTIEQTYTWLDEGLTNGVTYYYNLITQDLDGVQMVANEQPVSATPMAHLPTRFALHQNYPNPFNPWTDIKYDIPEDTKVTLKVYNVLGAEVATLVDAEQEANFYTVRWDTKDLASGVYFCTITAGDFKAVKKMVLLK